jgi:hypothetical protein
MRPLFDLITSFSNPLATFHKAARGKRRGAAVAGFEFDLEDNLFHLQTELRAGSYRPGPPPFLYPRSQTPPGFSDHISMSIDTL